MFYPQLAKLKTEYAVPSSTLDKLDMWLGLLPKSDRRGFTSEFFAREYEIDYNTAQLIFAYATDIGVLSVNYEVHCSECNEFVKTLDNINDLEETYVCDNGHITYVTDKDIMITYNLCVKPSGKSNKKKADILPKHKGVPQSLNIAKQDLVFRQLILDKEFYFPDLDDLKLAFQRVEDTFTYKGTDQATVKGKALEHLTMKLFEYSPAFKCAHDVRTSSNQIDVKVNVVPTIIQHPFLQKLGDIFLVECKNKNEKITSRVITEVNAILSDFRCSFGVVIGRDTLTGGSEYKDANSRRIKAYYQDERVIIVFTFKELKQAILTDKKSLITILEEKYNDFLNMV